MLGAVQRRPDDLRRFYSALGQLEQQIGGRRLLADCRGRMEWPSRGVYFFMEDGEERSETGSGPRIVRVGTHALTAGSRTTLWKRLSQHKGHEGSGGGNHRGSIFRLLVGSTLLKANGVSCPSWGIGGTADLEVRQTEAAIEMEVSGIIRAMPFLWLAIDDPPGPASLRGMIERNSIALLSNLDKPPLDPPSPRWRGAVCDRGKALVRDSGMWNQKHVDEGYDPAFLDVLDRLVSSVGIRA